MMRRYLLLRFKRSRKGQVSAILYDNNTDKIISVPFWDWLECLDVLQNTWIDDYEEQCLDCPYYCAFNQEGGDPDGKEKE